MEQERQRAQAHSGRGGARITETTLRPERRPPTAPRSSGRAERNVSFTPPPQILSAGRQTPPSSVNRIPGRRIRLSSKSENPSRNARKNPLEAERFRDVLFPQEGESPAERRSAFLLSPLYALIYAGCSLLCVHPLNLLTARIIFPLSAVIRAALPALIGTALCCVPTRFRFPEVPRLPFCAYRRLLREVLLAFLALQALLWGEWDAQFLIAHFALAFVLPPLIAGIVVSVAWLYRDWLNETESG